MVLGISVVAVPVLLSDDDTIPTETESTEPSSTTTETSAAAEEETVAVSALLATARISSDGIVLDGLVNTEGQRDALVDAARRRVGPALVEDNLQVATGLATSEGRDNGVVALQSLLAGMPDGVTVAATSAEGHLEVVGEAQNAAAAAALQSALNTVEAASPGIEVSNQVVVPPPPPPTAEELAAEAQGELDNLNQTLTTEVLFATSSNEPTTEFKQLLDRLPDLMDRHPSIAVQIVGHTDDRGSEGGNQKLSEQRANAAMDYLVTTGIDPTRLSARGAGEAEPIDTNTTRDGRARNRRVVLVATSIAD